MKIRFAPLFVIAVLIAAALLAKPADRVAAASGAEAKQNHEAIEGVWRAQMDGLPAITLNISYETGSLNGAILFYLLRKEPDKEETSTPGIPEPLMNPQFDGTTLTFAVSHRRAHPTATSSDPPVKFALTVIGSNKARLVRDNDGTSGLDIVKDTN